MGLELALVTAVDTRMMWVPHLTAPFNKARQILTRQCPLPDQRAEGNVIGPLLFKNKREDILPGVELTVY